MLEIVLLVIFAISRAFIHFNFMCFYLSSYIVVIFTVYNTAYSVCSLKQSCVKFTVPLGLLLHTFACM